ncbi:glycosyltransferase-like protein [Pseudacidovorax intermedius]|uniref:Glycosyltransferase-like protein n=1 Tax=Pseudacidovorax intermedius TaxID=433924 RepID=A0A370FCC1_9BURK|nr:MSMEG_0565 family glycosyltransferase [Pseudacidovorax intermedius]RDI23376.1 glycosyltransferase-like protein [Pseudacidovorax intermedius]
MPERQHVDQARAGLHVGLAMHSVLPRGGVIHTLELATALAQQGVAVTVFAPVEPGQILFRPLPDGLALRLQALPMPRPNGTLLADQVGERIAALRAALPAAAARAGVDVLHVQDSLNGAALAQRPPAMPWLRTVHHLDDFTDARLDAWQAMAWQRARAVCCVSDTWFDQLRARPEAPPVHRVFNGVDLQRFRPRPVAEDAAALSALTAAGLDDAPMLLALGGVEARKNSARLLRAFARLRREVPQAARARLLVAGGASLLQHGAEQQRWQAALADCGLDEGAGRPVWRTGPLPDAAIAALMRRARLLAMPSLYEGFGLVALEALACGTPVLVSRRAPFTEHLTGSPGVSWCEPEDEASVALGLARAWTQPRLPQPPAVCHTHSWARSARAHLQVYRQCLASTLSSLASQDPAPCLP